MDRILWTTGTIVTIVLVSAGWLLRWYYKDGGKKE